MTGWKMPKQPRDGIPALVLTVIAQVYQVAQHRTQPWYVDRSALNLVDATDSVDSAIYYAELSGWLVGAGEPPQSVAITADGVRLLEECGLI
jgi:hypothetical protein